MSLIAKSSGKDFAPAPEGVHTVRCYRIIDLGTQEVNWQGKLKQQHKILVNWEITNELQEDGRPFMISKKYTLSLGENAGLRKDLQAWRGRAFTPAELEGFDIKNLLGKPCMLNVVHESKDGKTYANIGSMMPLPGGMIAPKLVNPEVFFSLNDFDASVFEGLSDGIKAMITKSPEYQEQQAGYGAGTSQGTPSGNFEDDDIPF